jgi:succinyl-diaminopimelate desuccinylase
MTMEEKIAAAMARIDEGELVAFTRRLLRIPSVVRENIDEGSEEDVALEIAEFLRTLHLRVTIDYVAPRRPNVIAVLEGNRPGKCLLFEGHTDVVTAGPAADWSHPPFAAEVADGRIYGRGACDTKGNVAAMIMAVKAIMDAGADFAGKIILCIPVDEEGMMLGIKHFIRQGWADGVDGAIICEPEENNLCITQKGAMRAIIRTEGKMAHGCMPLAGINPVTRLARLITALDDYERREKARLGCHPFLGYPSITPTILKAPVEGEAQINVLPSQALAAFDIRTVPGQDHEAIKRAIAAIFAAEKEADSDFKATLEVIEERPWTEVSKDDPLVVALAEAYEKLTGRPPIYNGVPGATDGTFLTAWKGIPVVTTGAGNRLIPHQKDEYVDIAELMETTKLYTSAALRFLG